MIVYLARVIPVFVMYCVNGESGSSLLIESTDSMICLVTENSYPYCIPFSKFPRNMFFLVMSLMCGPRTLVENHRTTITAILPGIYIQWHRREKLRVCSADDG